MGKAKFGLEGFQYAQVVDDTTTGTPKAIPGLSTAKMDITNEIQTIMADDGPYMTVSGGITELKLEIEMYDIPSTDRQELLGVKYEGGIEKYSKNITPPDVACVFRSPMEDGKFIWFGLLKGKFGLPGADLKTKSDKMDAATDSITGQFVARGTDEDMLYIGREDNEEFEKDAFLEMVFNGTVVPTP